MTGLFCQSVFGCLGGHEDVNDADRPGRDGLSAAADNRGAPADVSGQWIDRGIDQAHAAMTPEWITPDMDGSVGPPHDAQTRDAQEGTAWNGHFGCMCHHPLFVLNRFGRLERRSLRPGNVHSADGRENVLKPVLARYADRELMRFFRADAAFAVPDLYKTPEAEGCSYAIPAWEDRCSGKQDCACAQAPRGAPADPCVAHLRRLRVSGPRHGTNHGGSSPRSSGIRVTCSRRSASQRSASQRSASWSPTRRWSRTGSFGSTTSAAPPNGMSRQAGGQSDASFLQGSWRGTRCGFSFMHRPAIPVSSCRAPICRRRRPTGLRTRLIRIGARVVRHARAIMLQPAEAAVGGALFTRIPASIQRLRAPPVPPSATGMTVSAIKPGRKRLDGSDPAGAVQTEFRFKPVAAAINRARSRTGCPNHDTACPRGLIRTQNSGSMIEMAF